MTQSLPLVMLVVFALPALAHGQSRPAGPFDGPTTTPSGSYLNLSPRRTAPPRSLVQPAPVPAQRTAAATPRPRVVCGMTLVPGDPAIDPGIAARDTRPPAAPSMRTIEPTICGATPAR